MSDTQAFLGLIKKACLALSPNSTLGVEAYKVYSTAEFRITIQQPLGGQRAQVPHLPRCSTWLGNIAACGASAFFATVPLTREGCHVRVHENVQDGVGKLVFVPPFHSFIWPANLIHGDGFRSGILGNPRLHFFLVVVPRGKEEAAISEANLFGEDAWGSSDSPSCFNAEFGLPHGSTEYDVRGVPTSRVASENISEYFRLFGH